MSIHFVQVSTEEHVSHPWICSAHDLHTPSTLIWLARQLTLSFSSQIQYPFTILAFGSLHFVQVSGEEHLSQSSINSEHFWQIPPVKNSSM